MTDHTPTTACPICRGTVRVIGRLTPAARLEEHVDSTRLRCEGSFTIVDQDQS